MWLKIDPTEQFGSRNLSRSQQAHRHCELIRHLWCLFCRVAQGQLVFSVFLAIDYRRRPSIPHNQTTYK